MERYGLLTTVYEKKTNKVIKIFRPVYSNDLEELKNKASEILHNYSNDDNTYNETEIFDYMECHYVRKW